MEIKQREFSFLASVSANFDGGALVDGAAGPIKEFKSCNSMDYSRFPVCTSQESKIVEDWRAEQSFEFIRSMRCAI